MLPTVLLHDSVHSAVVPSQIVLEKLTLVEMFIKWHYICIMHHFVQIMYSYSMILICFIIVFLLRCLTRTLNKIAMMSGDSRINLFLKTFGKVYQS
jgi:hypothetical protein